MGGIGYFSLKICSMKKKLGKMSFLATFVTPTTLKKNRLILFYKLEKIILRIKCDH